MEENQIIVPYKPKNKDSKPLIRLHKVDNTIRAELNGKTYATTISWFRYFALGNRKFCYLTEFYSKEERQAYMAKKEVEFKERVRKSLRG